MAFPPLPRPLDDDPHGKPTIGEWLVERCHADQAAARTGAETDRRIGWLLGRNRCPEAPGGSGAGVRGA